MKLSCVLTFIFLFLAAIPAETTNSTFSTFIIPRVEKTAEARIAFLIKVGKAYMEEGEFIEAKSAFERAVKINPQHAEARYTLGHLYIEVEQYKKAEELLLQLINEFPDDYTLLNNIAWLYATSKDPTYKDGKKAVTYAQEALLIAPMDFHVWSTLAEAYYIRGDYKRAYRTVQHMASLIAIYGQDKSKKDIDDYNAQIRKCRRAAEAQEAIESEDQESQKKLEL